MEPAELERFRAALEAARAELIAEGDVALTPNRTDAASVKRDDDAQPLNEMNQAIASRRNQERVARLRAIGRALGRMKTDPEDFGLCEACDEEIAARRLNAMPWARYCITCQEARDPGRGGRRNRLTDYV